MGDQTLDAMVRRIVAEELRGRDPRLVEQGLSPLGARVHCAAVRRRLAEVEAGERQIAGAFIRGRTYFLTQEAVAEELGRGTRPGLAKARAKPRPGGDGESSDGDGTAREQASYDRLERRYRGPKGVTR